MEHTTNPIFINTQTYLSGFNSDFSISNPDDTHTSYIVYSRADNKYYLLMISITPNGFYISVAIDIDRPTEPEGLNLVINIDDINEVCNEINNEICTEIGNANI